MFYPFKPMISLSFYPYFTLPLRFILCTSMSFLLIYRHSCDFISTNSSCFDAWGGMIILFWWFTHDSLFVRDMYQSMAYPSFNCFQEEVSENTSWPWFYGFGNQFPQFLWGLGSSKILQISMKRGISLFIYWFKILDIFNPLSFFWTLISSATQTCYIADPNICQFLSHCRLVVVQLGQIHIKFWHWVHNNQMFWFSYPSFHNHLCTFSI